MDFSSVSEHTSRKFRTCKNCEQPIAIGERYSRECGVWDGEFYTVVSHPECRADRNAYITDGDLDECGWLIEEVRNSGVPLDEFGFQPIVEGRLRKSFHERWVDRQVSDEERRVDAT